MLLYNYHIGKRDCIYKTTSLFIKFMVFAFLGLTYSCKKFVDIETPKTEIVGNTVFSNDISATSAVLAFYQKMVSPSSGFASGDNTSITCFAGLSSDELVSYSTNSFQMEFNQNELSETNLFIENYLWAAPYSIIYYANAVINGLENSANIDPNLKKQLEGEAKFTRAFCHFYLVNTFGDIPIVTSVDYRINSNVVRSPEQLVYAQIVSDLQEAIALMADDYSFSNGERVRPNKWAAMALLARVYLYTGSWQEAEAMAGQIIDNAALFNLESDLNKVFLKDSKEPIWQLMPVEPDRNTNEALNFILTGSPSTDVQNSFSLSQPLLRSFEAGDNRKLAWTNFTVVGQDTFYYPFKYKIKTGSTVDEYSVVFRLGEMYLIRAESRMQQGDLTAAKSDLDVIRARAGLSGVPSIDKVYITQAIERERQIEFFSEWGHRWFDLKRTGRANAILGPIKQGWQATDVLYPIPQKEIQNNNKLTQNDGY